MNLPHGWKHNLGKTALITAALAAFATFGAAPTLRADENDCQRRINRADHRLPPPGSEMAVQVEDRVGLAQLVPSNHLHLAALGQTLENVTCVRARARRAFYVQA